MGASRGSVKLRIAFGVGLHQLRNNFMGARIHVANGVIAIFQRGKPRNATSGPFHCASSGHLCCQQVWCKADCMSPCRLVVPLQHRQVFLWYNTEYEEHNVTCQHIPIPHSLAQQRNVYPHFKWVLYKSVDRDARALRRR